MIRRLAEYEVRPAAGDEVEALVREFLAAIAANEPATRYHAYRRSGSARFVHFMEFVDKTAEERHSVADYTRQFAKQLYPKCVEPPTFTDLRPV